MAPRFATYDTLPEAKSPLLRDVPIAIPQTAELEALEAELKKLKQRAVERAKKAAEDLKMIEDSLRRMKEKEKGKSKAVVDKVKRERDYTPSLDGDESRLSGSIHGKPRIASSIGHPPSSSRSSVDPRRSSLAEDLKKKKKKRKRENEESGDEHESQRARKASPAVNHAHPLKSQKATALPSSLPTKSTPGGPDFAVPPPSSLLPLRPPIPPPPVPGPSKQSEMTEDFSKSKQPAQTLVTTFYTSIEPWIRPLREEDVGFLEYTGDEVEPYIVPKLGRHYSEVWEEQDRTGVVPILGMTMQEDAESEEAKARREMMNNAPLPKWDPSTLSEGDLLGEERGHGPLTERVISALLPVPEAEWKGVKAAEDAMEGRPGGSGAAAARRERLNVKDLEGRIRDTMRFNGLLGDLPDYSEKVDDPIATALRQAQAELRTVVATNKARKERLVSIGRDRLGYQEYLELRDSIDKNITNLYTKLQKKDMPKANKKKKKTAPGSANLHSRGSVDADANNAAPCPAATGLEKDEENRLSVNEQLKALVEMRRRWVDEVGVIFEEKQRNNPGRVWGLPKESVFAGVEEEVRRILGGGESDDMDTRPG